MRVLVLQAITGNVLMDASRTTLSRLRGWELEVLFSYAEEGEVRVQAVKEAVTSLTKKESHDFIALLMHRKRQELYELVSRGHFIFWPIPRRHPTFNPLVIVVNDCQLSGRGG